MCNVFFFISEMDEKCSFRYFFLGKFAYMDFFLYFCMRKHIERMTPQEVENKCIAKQVMLQDKYFGNLVMFRYLCISFCMDILIRMFWGGCCFLLKSATDSGRLILFIGVIFNKRLLGVEKLWRGLLYLGFAIIFSFIATCVQLWREKSAGWVRWYE